MKGVVNHLFWEKRGLVDLPGRDKAMQWAKKCQVVSAVYPQNLMIADPDLGQ